MITTEEIRSTHAKIMAGMETGNIEYARTALTEFAALYPDQAQALSLDVISAYGIVLL